MRQFQELLRKILAEGVDRADRTGVGTIEIFGHQMRFDLSDGFPLATTKKTSFKLIATELLWFLSGSVVNEDLRALVGNDRPTIWEEWVQADGTIGPLYGKQWRAWDAYRPHGVGLVKETIDQIAWLVNEIKTNPDSRRLLLTAYNVADRDAMALYPCHTLSQFNVTDGKLSCQLYQRSADVFLGLNFNTAQYALLTHMLAHVTGLEVGELVHTIGSAHIYKNHIQQAEEVLTRKPYPLPDLVIKRQVPTIDDFRLEDFEIVGYQSHPAIAAEVAI